MTVDPTIFIVDDNPAFLESLSVLISSLGMKSQCFLSADEFLRAFDPQIPGCLVLDVRMPGISGLELQEKLFREPLCPAIIILTGHGEVPTAVRAMRQGAVEFLLKTCTEAELWDAIRRGIALDAANRVAHAERIRKQMLHGQLTPGERDVLQLVVAGRLNKNIAAALQVSLRTVEDRRGKVMQKLGANTVPDLVRFTQELESGPKT
jgi:two-component system response regulator FixJ